MEVKINVDDAKFNELFEKELDALSKEDMHNIFEECIKEYFRKNDYEVIDSLIMEKDNSYNWGNVKKPTDFTKRMVELCDMSKMQEIVDVCIDKLRDDYMNLLKEVISDAILHGLMDSYNMKRSMEDAIRETIYKIHQEQNN